MEWGGGQLQLILMWSFSTNLPFGEDYNSHFQWKIIYNLYAKDITYFAVFVCLFEKKDQKVIVLMKFSENADNGKKGTENKILVVIKITV